MRGSKSIIYSMVLGVTLWGAAIAAPGMAADVGCQKIGGEVSAQIDKSGTSKNLPPARAQFQAGIMDCMEGDDASANKHYLEAKALLGEPVAPAPAPIAVKAEAPVVDCQKFGREVSALIDKSTGAKHLPAARSAFQVGIMQCMEGEDANANQQYQAAKDLLSE
jgi:hypothetical protein